MAQLPMYWFIMAPYYSTFGEWLAIYFHHGVHFSDHLCVGVSKGLFLSQTLMDFREVKGISYNSSCLAQSPCAWVVVTTAIKYKISLWSRCQVLHWCIQHIEAMLLTTSQSSQEMYLAEAIDIFVFSIISHYNHCIKIIYLQSDWIILINSSCTIYCVV